MNTRIRKLTKRALYITPFIAAVLSNQPAFIGIYFFVFFYELTQMLTKPKAELPRPIVKVYYEENNNDRDF
jgi:hypothetical protein